MPVSSSSQKAEVELWIWEQAGLHREILPQKQANKQWQKAKQINEINKQNSNKTNNKKQNQNKRKQETW
jgi:hypothetical protein